MPWKIFDVESGRSGDKDRRKNAKSANLPSKKSVEETLDHRVGEQGKQRVGHVDCVNNGKQGRNGGLQPPEHCTRGRNWRRQKMKIV